MSDIVYTKAAVDAQLAAQAASVATTYLKLGGSTISGTRTGPYVEFDNASDEASLHFVSIPGFTGPYQIGVGVNADNAKGIVVDVTNPGAQGIQANLLTGADSTSIALNVQINPGITNGVAISGSSYNATGLIEKLHASGVPAAGQKMVVWQTDALAGVGSFGADILNVYADSGLFDAVSPVFRKNGGYLVVQDGDNVNANNVNLQRQHGLAHDLYAFSGSAGQYWGGRIAGTAPGGVVLSASTGPVGIGSETWVEGLRVQDVSGAAGLAFFGATAVNRYTGTPAAATDLTSALTLINALRADLLGYGLIA